MAMNLTLTVEANTREAEANLGRVDKAVRSVGETAAAAEKKLDAAFADLERNVTKVEQAQAKAAAATQQHTGSLNGLIASVGRYVAGGAALAAVKATVDWGGAIADLSAKTGISATMIQKLGVAAGDSGLSVDRIAQSVQMMADRLASGDKSAVAALKTLNLSLDTLLKSKPDQAFLTIARAVGEVEDPMQRAKLAADLFGRSGLDLTRILNAEFVTSVHAANAATEDQIAALDKAGDAFGRLWQAGKVLLATVLEPMLGVVTSLASGLTSLATRASNTGAIGFGMGPAGSAFGFKQWWANNPFTAGSRSLPEVPGGPGALPTAAPFGLGLSDTDIKLAIDDLTDQAKATTAAQKLLTRSSLRASAALEAEAEAAANTTLAIFNRAGNFATFLNSGRTSGAGGGYLYTGTDLTNPFLGLTQYPQATAWGGTNVTRQQGFNWGGAGLAGLGAAMPWLSQLVAGGSQGAQVGGSIGGTVGGILGSSSMFGGLAGMGGFAGVLGAAAPFLGPIAGIVGSLIGKLFGPSQQAIANREATGRIGQTQAGLLQQYGSIEAIASMGAAGDALAAAWGSQGVEGEKWFKELTAAFEKQNQLLSEQKGLQQQIADIEAQRTALAESLVPTYSQVVEAAGRYGISLESLGQQVEQLGATTSFTQMLNDLELLARAGGDMGGILAGMADEISTLVQRSIAFGTTIPSNMRPFIEELARAGKLLNANGEAITDLSTLTWGAEVKTQADLVTEAMSKLDETLRGLTDRLMAIADALANLLPSAAQQGARGVQDALSGISGPDIRVPEVEIGEAGPEAVIPLGRMSASSGVNVTINVAGYLDSQVARSHLASVVATELGRELRARRLF